MSFKVRTKSTPQIVLNTNIHPSISKTLPKNYSPEENRFLDLEK